MDYHKTRKYFFLILLMFSVSVNAAVISGKITDETNQPLPFVSVYIQGTTQGVTSNKEGNYSMELSVGKHDLVFQFIGYVKHGEIVHVESTEQKIILNVKMEPQPYEIAEVTVSANAEDPAYEVMRKAIKMRKYYLNLVQSYSCDVYIKGVQRVTNYPKKFMGFDVNAEGDIDPKTGIFYLSESVSKFSFMQPDKVHEVMISSKVSGNSKAFSFNRTSDLLMNFYENIVNIQVISKRGFVSPLSESAMFYYNYHLAGTFYENGKAINKIQVIPKREHDPIFRGYIYITDNTWRIHSTDLYIVKDAGIQFVDTLRINQVHLPVTPISSGKTDANEVEVWMIFSNKLSFSFSFLNFKGNGMYLSIHSKYNVKQDLSAKNPLPPPILSQTVAPRVARAELKERKKEKKEEKKLFSPEIMKVNDDANKKDTIYWAEMRPVQLTSEESLDYRKKDSIQVIHESKPFQDSVDRKTNKFKPMNLLLGYSYDQRYKKRSLYFSPMIKNIQFNTVQGLVAAAEISLEKKYESGQRIITGIAGSYGFSDKRLNPIAKFQYEYNVKKFANIGIEGGKRTIQFNDKNPISSLVNSVNSLVEKDNYAKLYEKNFVEISHNSELMNGLYFRTSLQYAERAPLMNTSNYTFFPDQNKNKNYTSNDPLYPMQDSMPSFSRNKTLEFRANLRIRFAQKYVTRPDEKWVYGSKYPTLRIEYRKGINNILGSDVDYDLLKFSISDRIKMGLLGRASYIISAGTFLNKSKMQFMDYYHFSGNKTIFSNFDFTGFQLLDYYTYSTNGSFIEAHYEHDFGGFILNKFPLLRKLKVNELAGIHYLYTDKLPNYFEVFVGIEKLRIARFDFVTSFTDKGRSAVGFRVGLEIGR